MRIEIRQELSVRVLVKYEAEIAPDLYAIMRLFDGWTTSDFKVINRIFYPNENRVTVIVSKKEELITA